MFICFGEGFFLATWLMDLSCLTRDQTWALAVKALSPNHWTAREFLKLNKVIL